MTYGRANVIDYDLLAAICGSGGSGPVNWKPIPLGSYVAVDIPSGTPVDTEFNATVEPDEGYLLSISSITLTVPSGIEANVLVETDAGVFPLLANNATSDVTIDASDFLGLGGLKKLVLYAKVATSPASDVTVSMSYSGRQVGR